MYPAAVVLIILDGFEYFSMPNSKWVSKTGPETEHNTKLEPVLNPLPDDKILDWSKLKAFADDNLKAAKMMISLYDRVENIVGKKENAGSQHFLLFPQCFQKASFPEVSKHVIVWEWIKLSALKY